VYDRAANFDPGWITIHNHTADCAFQLSQNERGKLAIFAFADVYGTREISSDRIDARERLVRTLTLDHDPPGPECFLAELRLAQKRLGRGLKQHWRVLRVCSRRAGNDGLHPTNARHCSGAIRK